MQSNRTALPSVCLKPKIQRNTNPDSKISVEESKTHSKSAAFLLPNKRQLHPLNGSPYKTGGQCFMYPNHTKQSNKTAFVQRIVSAKMLRIKALQNQLTDAHYHLNELANENRLLKTLQKRQDSALRQYEGTNAELPRIINSHHEELRSFQSKYKKLRTQHRSTCDILKEKEIELNAMQAQNKHLLQLSKDRNLEERENLQMKVSDLNFRINQQDETIKTLNRKLAVETKYLKHQVHLEVMKHKETQKRLQETLDKIKTVEELLGNKDRRLLRSKNSSAITKVQNIRGRSQSSFDGNSYDINSSRSNSKLKIVKMDNEDKIQTDLLNDTKDDKFEVIAWNLPHAESSRMPKSETMENLQHLRNFRLQKNVPDKRIPLDSNIDMLLEKDDSKDNSSLFSNESSNFELISKIDKEKSSFAQLDRLKNHILGNEDVGTDKQKLFLQKETVKFTASQSKGQYRRLTNNDDEDFDLVKDSLNLEREKDSFTIEDVDKLISQHLYVTEMPGTSDSVTSLSPSLEQVANKTENNFQTISSSEGGNDRSKLLLLNMELNKSLNHEGYLTFESSENSQENLVTTHHEANQNLLSNQVNSCCQDTFTEKNLFLNNIIVNVKNNDTQQITTSKSFDSLENVELTSQKQKLCIKHSISEESEPDTFAEINNEMNNETSNTLQSISKSKDDTNQICNKNSQTNNDLKESLASNVNINYDKEKLLAAMKAIDDNENFEIVGHTSRRNTDVTRSQVTEVVHRGLSAHLRKKEIIRELFEHDKLDQPKT